MDNYELRYLREVMQWLQHEGGKYEPLDFEYIYADWQNNISNGLPSALPMPHGPWEFIAPPLVEDQSPCISTEGASWAMEGK